LPMVTSAGLLAVDDAVRKAFVEHLEGVSRAAHAVTQLRGRPGTAIENINAFSGYVSFELALKNVTDEAYWNQLSSRNRGKIRKSRKAGTMIEFGGQELLDMFYGLHLRRNRELSTPVYPKEFFAAILDAFPKAHIALARNAGEAVAGMLNVGYKGVMNYLFGSSDSRFFDSYPNNHLFLEFIEHSRRDGYARIDFGRTPLGTGTYQFKTQWGAVEVPLHYQYLGKDANRFVNFSIQQVRQSIPFRVFARVWSRYLPARVTQKIGPSLIKRMPLA
jgi:hypothetical protein